MRYGLDFGTSNSSIAVLRDGRTELIPIEPSVGTDDSAVLSSVLYIEREGGTLVGQAAVDEFVARNVGREVVKTRLNTGEIISTVYGDEWVQFDVDRDMPGRFFQSLKSYLAEKHYEGTDVFGTFYTLEELIAAILRAMKERADAYVGRDVRDVVLGRPVRFSNDPAADRLAQERLEQAAKLAGFEGVTFVYEPVGAAMAYEAGLEQPETALTFDFGGGTLDFSVMRLGRGAGDRSDNVLATGGVLIGGNTLDEDIMERRLMRYFGYDVTWRSRPGKELPMPRYVFEGLRAWYTIPQLQERDILAFLRQVRRSCSDERKIKALECLVRKNYGWDLFQAVEDVKCLLSEQWLARLDFQREVIRIREFLARLDFEHIIAPRLTEIDRRLDEVVSASGLATEDIDVVLCTGGSSLIPAVERLLERKFGRGKVKRQAVFTSVVSGLAVAAGRLS